MPALAALRESVGLPADHGGQRLRVAPKVSLLPASFDEPGQPSPPLVHRYREVPDDAGAAPLPRWWAGNRDPLVYVTFGTVSAAVPSAAAALRTVVGALAALPVRLLVTIGDQGDAAAWSDLPPNVHVEQWVPQRDVLNEASTIVCHGGMVTLLGALAAAVPAVVVPQFADQPHNADRIEAIGAGLRVGGGDTTVDEATVSNAVRRVLSDPALRAGARRAAEEIASLPPVDAVVELIEASQT